MNDDKQPRGREAAELGREQHYEQFDPDWPFPDESEPMSLAEMHRLIVELEADCGD